AMATDFTQRPWSWRAAHTPASSWSALPVVAQPEVAGTETGERVVVVELPPTDRGDGTAHDRPVDRRRRAAVAGRERRVEDTADVRVVGHVDERTEGVDLQVRADRRRAVRVVDVHVRAHRHAAR